LFLGFFEFENNTRNEKRRTKPIHESQNKEEIVVQQSIHIAFIGIRITLTDKIVKKYL
jgi:hypothetical protein